MFRSGIRKNDKSNTPIREGKVARLQPDNDLGPFRLTPVDIDKILSIRPALLSGAEPVTNQGQPHSMMLNRQTRRWC
jgi:hypothetical protein